MNPIRNGKITSSQAYRVMGTPKVKQTYLEELEFSSRMKCSLTQETNARPTTWGKFVEKRVFDLLPIEYKLTSKDTIQHPEIEHWCGSPDGVSNDSVFDIKCPYTRKSFCQLHRLVELNSLEYFKKNFDDYYWQLVSNAILTNKDKAELIVYLPHQKELDEIREMCQKNTDIELETKIFWIANSIDDDLPHQPNESEYPNLFKFSFDVPQEDKDLLNETIKSLSLK